MALTLEAEQRLDGAKVTQFFESNRSVWLELAAGCYKFTADRFGAKVRPDDVAKVLLPILEVNTLLRSFLAMRSLKQKYWIGDFGDLILDRTWDEISKDGAEGEAE